VLLLINGIAGVTIEGVSNGEVRYMATGEAIKQRFVNDLDINLYEKMGICFGREPETDFQPTFKQVKGHIERYM